MQKPISNQNAVILIVDDKPANLMGLEGLLATPERIFIKASSGDEAIRLAAETRPDLVILDVQMPDLDGFEVAKILKLSEATKDVPVIFASAEERGHASMMKGFGEGAVDYLVKPLDPDVTRAKVSVLLQVQLQKKQLIEKNVQLEKSALSINNSADIIGMLDADTLEIEEMNQSFYRVTGFDIEEVRGTCLLAYFAHDDKEFVRELHQSDESAGSFNARFHCKNQEVKWLDWNVVIRYDKWFVNARDITQQKRADERIRELNKSLEETVRQLETANKELEAFSYSVSHDLRAPLRALYGNADILMEDFGHVIPSEGKQIVKKLQNNVRRMDQLIKDLLAFSRIGKKEVWKSQVDMESQVMEIVAETKKAYAAKVEVHIGALPPAYGDNALLNQVWTNLISNAFKYSSKKECPRIEIGARVTTDRQAEYFVSDNGAGFDMQYAGKLFGTFQRLHDASEFEGTGIGLAIAHRIIHKHGGTIRAEAWPEKGATFSFTIPDRVRIKD